MASESSCTGACQAVLDLNITKVKIFVIIEMHTNSTITLTNCYWYVLLKAIIILMILDRSTFFGRIINLNLALRYRLSIFTNLCC